MTRDQRILEADVRFCREATCRAPIVFAEGPSGRTLPIDVTPSTDPKTARYYLAAWQIDRVNPAQPRYLLGLASEAEPDDPRFASHFTTCTRASQFSRKGKV
jgi:hypothetical protein